MAAKGTIIVHIRPRVVELAAAFAIGDAWGHAGHGIPWGHRLLSVVVSFAAAWWLLRWTVTREVPSPTETGQVGK